MGHAAVDFKVHRHTGQAQFVGVVHALVYQRVTFGQADPGGGHTVHIGCMQRGKTPVLTLCAALHIVAKEPADGGLFQHQPARKGGVRWRVLVGRATRVDQQLQRQRQARIARQDGIHRGQRAACTVAAHSQPCWVCAQGFCMGCQPLQGIPRIVAGRGKAVLRRQPVVQRHHHAASKARQLAAKNVVRGNAANGEAAAMHVQQQWQPRVGAWCIQPGGHRMAIAGRDVQVFHPRQGCLGHLQHAGTGFVGNTSVLG